MFGERLLREFSPYGTLTKAQLHGLEEHYNLLHVWNQRLNLTRITGLEEIVRLHYCESLFLARQLPSRSLRIADIGSGAGFPGIPVAVLRPDCAVTLIESHQRKAVFLREVSRQLPNVHVEAKRAEEIAERFDWGVSRAVRASDLIRTSLASQWALLLSKDEADRLKGAWALVDVPWGRKRVLARSIVPCETLKIE
jgi:16S rRNA (guanine(527)-N(7))-methyltransferase RsmG